MVAVPAPGVPSSRLPASVMSQATAAAKRIACVVSTVTSNASPSVTDGGAEIDTCGCDSSST